MRTCLGVSVCGPRNSKGIIQILESGGQTTHLSHLPNTSNEMRWKQNGTPVTMHTSCAWCRHKGYGRNEAAFIHDFVDWMHTTSLLFVCCLAQTACFYLATLSCASPMEACDLLQAKRITHAMALGDVTILSRTKKQCSGSIFNRCATACLRACMNTLWDTCTYNTKP